MSQHRQHLVRILQLNFAVLLISTSGVLGRYIVLHPAVTIFYRTLIASLVFYLFCRWKKVDLRIDNKRDLLKIIIAGVLLGGHWVTYFFSLQFSNVAIALLSLFTYPVITSILEPFILKTKFNRISILLGMLVLGGVYFLSPQMDFENNSFLAVVLGVISAFLYALRNILMKREVERYNGTTLMFHQIIVVAICLFPAVFFSDIGDVIQQWKPLLTLAVLTTCIGHTLFLLSFRNFTISTASIMSSMQPVYGILLGILFLDEIPSLKTLIGGLLIISAVVIESSLSFRKKSN